ncbi:MAG: hypothetical protein QG639_164 [Patescibacteria group bacterium]|nr:hypothetical protein [Patescibacteria group bacterium]
MSTQPKETELYSSSKPIDFGVLAAPLIKIQTTNGHHLEQAVTRQKTERIPSYIAKRFSEEDIVESMQGKQLEAVLSKHPYPSKEHGKDQIEEGRRFLYDMWSDWKRSDLEVKRYAAMIDLIEAGNHQIELLEELINRWVTPLNFMEIAQSLDFTPDDVASIASDPQKSKLNEPSRNQTGTIDKQSEWYPLILEVISEDDIVPLVLITELIAKSKNKPSIYQLYEGLQLYLGRLHWQTRMTNDLIDLKSKRLKDFKVVKAETEAGILENLKKMSERKLRINAPAVNQKAT